MKSNRLQNFKNITQPFAPYPNAATKREILNKAVDRLLIVASCIGAAAMLLFLTALA